VLPDQEPVCKLLGDGLVFNQEIQYRMAQLFCRQASWYRRQNPECPTPDPQNNPVNYQGMNMGVEGDQVTEGLRKQNIWVCARGRP
jgi:hypothetical protein